MNPSLAHRVGENESKQEQEIGCATLTSQRPTKWRNTCTDTVLVEFTGNLRTNEGMNDKKMKTTVQRGQC